MFVGHFDYMEMVMLFALYWVDSCVFIVFFNGELLIHS